MVEAKIRLHKFVLEKVRADTNIEYTSPEVQRNIESFGVKVDGEMVYNRLYWVLPWSEVDFEHWPKRITGNFEQVRFLREDDHYILIYKPVGVVVETGAGHQHDNLLTWLNTHHPLDANQDYHLVHRLDKDTQGLMLIAKSLPDQEFFQNQFRNRTTVKKYLALVDNPVDNLWEITNWQARDKQNPTRQILFWDEQKALKYDPKARQAISVIRPKIVCNECNQSIVEVEIKTGRMHQIRLQCEALGFPLSNDKIYHSIPVTNLLRTGDQFLPDSIERRISPKDVHYLQSKKFLKLKQDLFGDPNYGLLSNYLKIRLPGQETLESECKNLESLMLG